MQPLAKLVRAIAIAPRFGQVHEVYEGLITTRLEIKRLAKTCGSLGAIAESLINFAEQNPSRYVCGNRGDVGLAMPEGLG